MSSDVVEKVEKSDESSPVDIYKRYRVVREQSTQADESQSNAQSGSKVLVSKKTLNIPICDIKIDISFGTHLSVVETPSSYIRFVKRVGEDHDPVSEFRVDNDDKQWLQNVLLVKFPEESCKFTLDNFESVLAILEKTNDTKRDTIVLTIALKAILDKSGLDASMMHKLTPDIYKYWYSKRDKRGKPLTRQFWPPTLSNDTNPHQVFRVRDKERYKLRRQHRKNDLDSFRKMQQLRKEFQQARVLVQLMLEREKMQQASFRTEREIFELQLKEKRIYPCQTDQSRASFYEETRNPRFEPQFKHVWATLIPPTISATSLVSTSAGDVKSADGNGDGLEETQGSIAESAPVVAPFPPPIIKRGAGRPPKNPIYQIIDGVQILVHPEKKSSLKRKKSMDKKGSLYIINAQGEVEICSLPDGGSAEGGFGSSRKGVSISQYMSALGDFNYQGYLQPSYLDVNNPVEAIIGPETENLIHECVEGPRSICRPQWPNFLSSLSMRDQVYSYCTPSEYLHALEYKYDDNFEPLLPSKFRSRCRVGRGGRIVVDRIPVYPDTENDEHGDAQVSQIYQYPVSLRPHTRWILNQATTSSSLSSPQMTLSNNPNVKLTAASLQAHNNTSTTGSSATQDNVSVCAPKVLPDLPLSNRKLLLQTFRRNTKINANNWSSSLPMMGPSIPTLVPPPRVQFTSEKTSKLQSILAESDSEDERVIIPKSTNGFDIDRSTNTKTAATELAMTKFVVNLGYH